MRQQTTALILSALLLSTLAHGPIHERLNRHLHEKLNHQQSRSLLSVRENQDDACDKNCTMVCTPLDDSGGDDSGNVTVSINVDTGIIAVFNETAQVAIAINVKLNLFVLFNGSSGAAVVIDIGKGTVRYIPAGSSQNTWKSRDGKFDDYIGDKTHWDKIGKDGTEVDKSSPSKDVLEVIVGVLIHLSLEYSIRFKSSNSDALKVVLKITTRLASLFKGPLKGFLKIVTSVRVSIRGGLSRVLGLLDGLGKLLGNLQGGIDAIIKSAIKLDLAIMLYAKNGVEIFVYILTALSVRLDVGALLGTVLKSVDVLLGIIVKLGGDLSQGLAGLLKVVVSLIALANGKGDINTVIKILIYFAVTQQKDGSLEKEYHAALEVLLKLIVKINTSGKLDNLVKILKDLQDDKLEINGVKISAVVAILIQVGSILALDLIVRVLLLLRAVVKIETAIIILVISLIKLLNSTLGIYILIQIIPGLKIDASVMASGNILGNILKGIGGLLAALLKGDFSGIPVIGPILVAVSVSVKTASGGSVTLVSILKVEGGRLRKFLTNPEVDSEDSDEDEDGDSKSGQEKSVEEPDKDDDKGEHGHEGGHSNHGHGKGHGKHDHDDHDDHSHEHHHSHEDDKDDRMHHKGRHYQEGHARLNSHAHFHGSEKHHSQHGDLHESERHQSRHLLKAEKHLDQHLHGSEKRQAQHVHEKQHKNE